MTELEQKIVSALNNSVNCLFTTMIDMPCAAGEASNGPCDVDKDVTGMIGLAGEYRGNISVNLPRKIALQCVSTMLGKEINDLDGDAHDAIGEITNIIVGGAKNELYENGVKFDISTPTVIIGSGYSVYSGDGSCHLCIPYSLEEGIFYIESSIKQSN